MAFQRKSSKHIADAQDMLDAYNAKLAKAGNEFRAAEKQLRALSAYMLATGGTRASEINYHPIVPPEE